MPGSKEAWERVLAAIEADALRSEALLRAVEGETTAAQQEPEHAPADVALPAEWLLPSTVELPPLDAMPPVPTELSERILDLRSQILGLQAELAEAMRNLPKPPRAALAPTPAEVPSFIDRRL